LSEQKPLLVVIAGPMGAGKTTFYDAHLKKGFPALVPPSLRRDTAAAHAAPRAPCVYTTRETPYSGP